MQDERTQKHPLGLAVVLVMIAGAVVGAVYMMRRADARITVADTHAGAAAVAVDVLSVRPVDVPLVIESRGFLRGFEEVTVHSEVAGRVVSREVDDGDTVQVDQPLLRIDDTFYTLRVRQARAELQRAQAQLSEVESQGRQADAQVRSAEAARANKATELEWTDELYGQDLKAPIELDRARTALRMAEADLAALQAAVKRTSDLRAMSEAAVQTAQAILDESEAYLERCVVRSPIGGRINRFAIEAGEYAVTTAPLVEVVRLDRLKMIVELTDKEVGLLDAFTRAELTVDSASDRVYPAILHHVAPKVDSPSRKFRVELHVDNQNESLLAGAFGKVSLKCGHLAGRICVPREAVFKHFGADACLIAQRKDGVDRAVLRHIDIRSLPGRIDEVEVTSGLAAGDRVVVTRRPELRDTTPLNVVSALPDPSASTPTQPQTP